MKTIAVKPKFNVGDIVSFLNESAFNPTLKVTTIGTITAIHIYAGNTVRYDINGHCQTHMDESCFTSISSMGIHSDNPCDYCAEPRPCEYSSYCRANKLCSFTGRNLYDNNKS